MRSLKVSYDKVIHKGIKQSRCSFDQEDPLTCYIVSDNDIGFRIFSSVTYEKERINGFCFKPMDLLFIECFMSYREYFSHLTAWTIIDM